MLHLKLILLVQINFIRLVLWDPVPSLTLPYPPVPSRTLPYPLNSTKRNKSYQRKKLIKTPKTGDNFTDNKKHLGLRNEHLKIKIRIIFLKKDRQSTVNIALRVGTNRFIPAFPINNI